MDEHKERLYAVQYYPCDRCNGTGTVRTAAPVMDKYGDLHPITKRPETCPRCQGTGKLFDQEATYG